MTENPLTLHALLALEHRGWESLTRGAAEALVDDGTPQCVTVVCWYSVSAGSPSTSV